MTRASKTVGIPYGKGAVRCSLPSERLLGVLVNRPPAGRALKYLLKRALDRPLCKASLREMASGKRKILIAVPDDTRKAHLKKLLPEILKAVAGNGRKVTVIVATGLHVPLERQRLKSLVGAEACERCDVVSHDQRRTSLIDMGRTPGGVPIVLNRNLIGKDLVISIGVIEPHLYAGYSGGVKTVAIGLAGEATIRATHGVRFLADASTRIGSVDGNVFQDALRDISAVLRIDFCLNVVNDSAGNARGVFAGDAVKVFEAGASFSRRLFEVRAEKAADIAICGIGYPKDINLYQASRAINYVANTERPIVKRSGVIIVVAELKGGIGESEAERRFHRALKDMGRPQEFVDKVERSGCLVGEHRAYMVAKALCRHTVVFVSGCDNRIFDGLPIRCFKDVAAAVRFAEGLAGSDAGIYVVPRALATIATAGA
jgi:nickel-dependent lactate racemase